MALEVACTNEEKILITINPSTKTGKPAKVDGIPEWSVLSGNATVIAADDGMSAFVVSQDAVDANPTLNITQYKVSADADLGEGVEPIEDTITLHVLGAQASNLGLVAGAAVPK